MKRCLLILAAACGLWAGAVYATVNAMNGVAITTASSILGKTPNSAIMGQTIASAAVASPVITAQTPGSGQSGLDTLEVGFKFTVGGASITVTEVARWNVGSDTGTHAVTIRKTSDWSVVGTATVANTGQPSGAYVWATLASPVVLTNGVQYFIGSMEATGGDAYGDQGPVTSTAAISGVQAAYGFAGTGPNNGNAGQSYGPANFKYY